MTPESLAMAIEKILSVDRRPVCGTPEKRHTVHPRALKGESPWASNGQCVCMECGAILNLPTRPTMSPGSCVEFH